MNDDQLFLANAYVDGELTDDERVLAEADPAVMAEVDELRALQSQLRDVEPPSESTRESAIAAAMAEFKTAVVPPETVAASDAEADAASDAGAAPPMAPRSGIVVPLHRRSWFRPVLTAAAAAVGVGFFAVVIARGGGDDDDFDSADEPAAEVAEEPADEPADEAFGEFETDAADDAGADAAVEEAAEEPADEMAEAMEEPATATEAEEMADDEMAEEEPADEPAAEPADEPADEPAEEPADEPAADGGAPIDLTVLAGGTRENPIVVEEDLVTYAIAVIRNRDLQALEPSPNHACADAENVVAGGFAEFDGQVVEALIDIALDDSTVLAWTGDDAPIPCAAIFQGILPTPTG